MSTAELKRNPSIGSDPGATRRNLLWATALIFLFSLAIFFREFLLSGFNEISGDPGDNRFNLAILEHWWAFLHGDASFRSPNFYWPARGVLGYSDALFLFVPPFAIGRAAGLDSYYAFEVTLILLKAIGFFSMLWLLQSFVRLNRPAAIVASALFTLSNLYYTSVGHVQLVAVVFVPLLAGLCCAAWQAHGQRQKRRARMLAALAGTLLALLLFTAFYIGWFAILAAAIVVLVALLAATLQKDARISPRNWTHTLNGKGLLFASAFAGFAISLIPFLLTYLPVLKQMGGRSFQELLLYSSHPMDLINVGQGNSLWGRPINSLMLLVSHRPMIPAEREVGWPPLTLALVGVGLFFAFKNILGGQSVAGLDKHRYLAGILGVSFIAGWVLSVDYYDHSLWWLVFKFIPGGSSIRAVARFNVILNFFVVIVAGIVLNEVAKHSGHYRKTFFGLLSVFLIAEQINTVPIGLIHRDNERSILGQVHKPPSSCASFFLSRPADRGIDPFSQVDAMLIARANNIPTLNGYSGWPAPGWDLVTVSGDYLQNVRSWAIRNNVRSGLCGLDLQNGSWTAIDFANIPYLLNSKVDFRKGGNALSYKMEGWGSNEEGGSWTLGERSVLLLDLPAVPATDLQLTLKAHAFVSPSRPSFKESLLVNRHEVAEWSVSNPESIIEKRVIVPLSSLPSRQLRIEFVDHDPRSPAEFGLSMDNRKLGLALEALKVVPIDSQSHYGLGSQIDFKWGGDAYRYEKDGWAQPEDGGSWTLGERSTLEMGLASLPATDLLLTVKAHAFLVPQRPRFKETLRVNNTTIADWWVDQPQFEKRVRVPRSYLQTGDVRIEFFNHDPRSPADVKYSVDDRKIGLAVESLKLEPLHGSGF